MRIFAFFLIFTVIFTPSAEAASTCDAGFWNVLRARAWMEGKHDMEAAQTFITRPKSVLALSCFNKRLEELGREADFLFSDNLSVFTNPSFFPKDDYEPRVLSDHGYEGEGVSYSSIGYAAITAQNMDNTLRRLIETGLRKYLQGQFGSSSMCENMDAVWDTAKCRNISTGAFMKFSEIKATGPRTEAPACNSQRGKWQNQIAIAFPAPGGLGALDPAKTYLQEIIDVPSCGSLNAIFTGITVTSNGSPYPDAVCPNPKCYYDGNGNCSGT